MKRNCKLRVIARKIPEFLKQNYAEELRDCIINLINSCEEKNELINIKSLHSFIEFLKKNIDVTKPEITISPLGDLAAQ